MPPAGDSNALDTDDYDPINHLNQIFSHPSTISAVPKTFKALRVYQNELEQEIAELVAKQAVADAESVRRIQAAKNDLAELFKKIEGVQEKAAQTEQSITGMTADIKRLDNTKKNLTLSMTALKRLQMLTTAYEQLQELSSSRQYRECAQLLQAVLQLMAHFKTYRSIDQIATLSRNVSDLQRELLEQVCEDFELTFAKGEVSQRRGMLAEACLVMDALGDNARSRLITWFCNTQLREYRQVFRGSEEAGSLDNISRRYAWFKRMLKNYDDHYAVLFPVHWRVDEMLANAFCEGTRDDYRQILAKSMRRTDGQSLDVNLLLRCLQETLDFEHGLERKFTNSSRVSMDTSVSSDERVSPFTHAISEAFEPYLSIWVEAQDKQMAGMIPKYKSQPPKPPDEDFSPQMVVHSSTELFNFYRLTLGQCAKLSTGARLVELSKVFAKYLDQYAQQVLLYYISEKPTSGTPSRIPSVTDIVLTLNTADYCYSTCNQLEEKIKGRIDEGFRESVDLQNQADEFMGIAGAAIRGLVRQVEVDLEPSWREMRNTGWSKIQNVVDQSNYITELSRRLEERATEVMKMLAKQQYARAFCDNLVDLISTSYIANVVHCKPISESGAEQEIDVQAFVKILEDLINLNSSSGTISSAGYNKRVSQNMSRVMPLLKTLQTRPSPPESLIQAYLAHIADKSDANFRKVLDLKGIRKQEQTQLLELFAAHRSAPRHESLPARSPLLTPLTVQSSGGVGVGVGGVSSAMGPGGVMGSGIGTLTNATAIGAANLQNLHGKFDPAGFGSAIITAARDGVDRFGSPSLGSTGSRTVSPPLQGSGVGGSSGGPSGAGSGAPNADGPAGNVAQNLKNIGKFFKRDLGGLGGRFGGNSAQ